MSSTRPWMPWYVADYLADTQHLNHAEHGVYMLLLMYHWQHGSIPDDPELLARIARFEPSANAQQKQNFAHAKNEWNRIWKNVSQFFQKSSQNGHTVLKQKRLASELERAIEISGKRRAAALQKHSKRRANAHANADQKHTHARASTLHPQSQSHKEGLLTQTQRARARAAAFDDWPADYRERFLEAYRHHADVKGMLEAIDRLAANPTVSFEVLINKIENYIATKPPERQFLNGKTFIEQERWNDKPAASNGNGRHRPSNSELAAQLAREAEERERGAVDAGGEAQRIGGAEIGGDDARDVSGTG